MKRASDLAVGERFTLVPDGTIFEVASVEPGLGRGSVGVVLAEGEWLELPRTETVHLVKER